jgi:hypothetical protein
MANNQDFISKYRQATTAWLTALNTLLAYRAQWDALDYSNTLTEEDFAGANSDIDLAAMQAAVASVEAIETFVASGHATNLYRLVV